jgi:hypothetical protein
MQFFVQKFNYWKFLTTSISFKMSHWKPLYYIRVPSYLWKRKEKKNTVYAEYRSSCHIFFYFQANVFLLLFKPRDSNFLL